MGAVSGAVGGAVQGVEQSVGDAVGDSRSSRYVRYLFKRAQEDQLAQVAGSLTFTTLLALVPFITIALGLFTAFPIFDQMRDALEEFLLDNLLPDHASSSLMTHITEFSKKAAGLTAAGVFALGVTAIMMMQTIDRAFNAIWRVPHPRPLAQRILVYWAAVSLGPILIGGGLLITSYLVSSSLGWLPGGDWVSNVLLGLIPLSLTTLAFTLLYTAVPNCDVQWRYAAVGGLVAAIGFEAMKNLFGAYIAEFPTYHLIYGAFAAIPIFLMWVYLSWLVTLGGGLVAATWPLMSYERAEMRKWPGAEFADAMRILALLYQRRNEGGAPARAIRAELRTGFSGGEALLEQLREAGWIGRVQAVSGPVRWALLADPGAVQVADVFRRFAFDSGMAKKRLGTGESALGDGIARIVGLIDTGLDATLAQAFDRPTVDPSGNLKA